jgi:(p)ppGpp synthase/HD superfamily hydrolase
MLRRYTKADGWPPGVTEAVAFASQWQGAQRRTAGEPYVEHLQEAMAFLCLARGCLISTC